MKKRNCAAREREKNGWCAVHSANLYRIGATLSSRFRIYTLDLTMVGLLGRVWHLKERIILIIATFLLVPGPITPLPVRSILRPTTTSIPSTVKVSHQVIAYVLFSNVICEYVAAVY